MKDMLTSVYKPSMVGKKTWERVIRSVSKPLQSISRMAIESYYIALRRPPGFNKDALDIVMKFMRRAFSTKAIGCQACASPYTRTEKRSTLHPRQANRQKSINNLGCETVLG